MQPQRNSSEEWQQPPEQPSQSPYATPLPQQDAPQPVVTMTPEQQPQQPTAPLPASTEAAVGQTAVEATAEPTPSETAEPETLDDEAADPNDVAPVANHEPVRWQAQEYIPHEKNAGWYVVFVLVVVAFMAVAILLMQSWTFAILVPVMAAALMVYVKRPPRVLDYTLSMKGLYVNEQLHTFAEFRGFGVIHDGLEYSVMLLPRKRFHPGVSVYFNEQDGEAIVDLLGAHLPMQELKLDPIDRLIRKLRI